MMKEMVYGGIRENEILYSGEYKGFDIAIVNRGTHPCAYIRMPDDMMEKLKTNYPETYDDYDSYYGSTHGGYTYCRYGNVGFEELKTGLWLGWDYAHAGDYYWCPGKPSESFGKKWTVGEILANAFEAVDTLEFDDSFSRTKYEDIDEDRDYEEKPEPCEDAVSRQVAIDTLLKWMRPICINNNGEVVESDDMVAIRRILKSLPPVQPTLRWITCSPETMPDDYTDVLVWFEYFRYGDYNCLYQTYGIGNYSTKYDSWMINHETGWHKLRVIAWMSLPGPYKEDTSVMMNRAMDETNIVGTARTRYERSLASIQSCIEDMKGE